MANGNFKKYSSIENSYQNTFIERFCYIFPELRKIDYTIAEKLDGCNCSFLFYPDKTFRWSSREHLLDNNGKLNGVSLDHILQDTELVNFFDKITKKSVDTNTIYQVYGELFSDSINRRVKYGKNPQFKIFDMRIGEELISQYDLSCMVPENIMVPFISMAQGLEEALNVNIEFDSKILNIENNICEGVVIKPIHKVYYSPVGSVFYLKKKNKKFMERERFKKEVTPVSDDLKAWREIFKSYINDNRITGIMSKFGEIESPKQFGDYIRYTLDDAKTDFKKDYTEYVPTPDNDKYVFNQGSYVVEFLKKRV